MRLLCKHVSSNTITLWTSFESPFSEAGGNHLIACAADLLRHRTVGAPLVPPFVRCVWCTDPLARCTCRCAHMHDVNMSLDSAHAEPTYMPASGRVQCRVSAHAWAATGQDKPAQHCRFCGRRVHCGADGAECSGGSDTRTKRHLCSRGIDHCH